jgi:hypothetical protein
MKKGVKDGSKYFKGCMSLCQSAADRFSVYRAWIAACIESEKRSNSIERRREFRDEQTRILKVAVSEFPEEG